MKTSYDVYGKWTVENNSLSKNQKNVKNSSSNLNSDIPLIKDKKSENSNNDKIEYQPTEIMFPLILKSLK